MTSSEIPSAIPNGAPAPLAKPSGEQQEESAEALLAAAYALDGPMSSRSLYARWAATYDSGFIIDSGYRYYEHVARHFAAHGLSGVRSDEPVIDIGCGTGLAGQALARIANEEHARELIIDGLDLSPEMLEQAAQKHGAGASVYRRLVEADLTQPLPIADSTYAGAFSSGTFTHGHVGADAIAELVRIVRPGGSLALGINAAHFAGHGFDAAFEILVSGGRITDLAFFNAPIYVDADPSDPDRMARVAMFVVA